MYGLTHSIETGLPIIKEPKVLKVGIGVPRGRAISIFIWRGKWVLRFGVYEGNKQKQLGDLFEIKVDSASKPRAITY
jgi:hypothetical protein